MKEKRQSALLEELARYSESLKKNKIFQGEGNRVFLTIFDHNHNNISFEDEEAVNRILTFTRVWSVVFSKAPLFQLIDLIRQNIKKPILVQNNQARDFLINLKKEALQSFFKLLLEPYDQVKVEKIYHDLSYQFDVSDLVSKIKNLPDYSQNEHIQKLLDKLKLDLKEITDVVFSSSHENQKLKEKRKEKRDELNRLYASDQISKKEFDEACAILSECTPEKLREKINLLKQEYDAYAVIPEGLFENADEVKLKKGKYQVDTLLLSNWMKGDDPFDKEVIKKIINKTAKLLNEGAYDGLEQFEAVEIFYKQALDYYYVLFRQVCNQTVENLKTLLNYEYKENRSVYLQDVAKILIREGLSRHQNLRTAKDYASNYQVHVNRASTFASTSLPFVLKLLKKSDLTCVEGIEAFNNQLKSCIKEYEKTVAREEERVIDVSNSNLYDKTTLS